MHNLFGGSNESVYNHYYLFQSLPDIMHISINNGRTHTWNLTFCFIVMVQLYLAWFIRYNAW